jgi:hypothetical protein
VITACRIGTFKITANSAMEVMSGDLLPGRRRTELAFLRTKPQTSAESAILAGIRGLVRRKERGRTCSPTLAVRVSPAAMWSGDVVS